MGTGLYDYEAALAAGRMPDEQFQTFFDTMQRKGLVHVESGANGNETIPFKRRGGRVV